MDTKIYAPLWALFLLLTTPLHGQLTTIHNKLRPGDFVVKQQVHFIDPGDAGIDQTWDFSSLRTIDSEYTLTYDLPAANDSMYIVPGQCFEKRTTRADELVTGTEHNTVYYYRMQNNTLTLLGHENPVVKLAYTKPLPVLRFPFRYGDNDSAAYTSEALYSGIIPVQARGYATITADAWGRMKLPDDVVLDTVLRVRSLQVIENIPVGNQEKGEAETTTVETCRWYLKGYRYPVFETIRSSGQDGEVQFATAFYYPLQDHFYLDEDPQNTAVLDRLRDAESKGSVSLDPFRKKAYRIFPNPTDGFLYVDLTLNQPSNVDYMLFSADGRLCKRVHRNKPDGVHREEIDCTQLPSGTYLLKLVYGTETASELIIKK